jgi:TRAP-type C4-dicarboxylate transport system substrate-binding protein
VWVMNKPWYDKLAAAQKKVIDDHCSNEWAGKVGGAWGDEEDSGQAKLEKTAGHTIVPISAAQLDVWKKAVEPVYTQWVKSADGVGVPGQTALDDLRKELAARKATN